MKPSLSKKWRAGGLLAAIVLSTLAGNSAQAQPANPRYEYAPQYSPPPTYRLGVYMQPTQFWGGAGWVWGVQITGVAPGSAANRAGLETNDIMYAANGVRVRSVAAMQQAIANSGGMLVISGINSRDGSRFTTPPLALDGGPIYGSGPGASGGGGGQPITP